MQYPVNRWRWRPTDQPRPGTPAHRQFSFSPLPFRAGGGDRGRGGARSRRARPYPGTGRRGWRRMPSSRKYGGRNARPSPSCRRTRAGGLDAGHLWAARARAPNKGETPGKGTSIVALGKGPRGAGVHTGRCDLLPSVRIPWRRAIGGGINEASPLPRYETKALKSWRPGLWPTRHPAASS